MRKKSRWKGTPKAQLSKMISNKKISLTLLRPPLDALAEPAELLHLTDREPVVLNLQPLLEVLAREVVAALTVLDLSEPEEACEHYILYFTFC